MTQIYFFVLWLVVHSVNEIAASTTWHPECPPPPLQCVYNSSALDEHYYLVEGKKLTVDYGNTYFNLKCVDNVSLESKAMPRFPQLVHVQRAAVTACAPPAGGYARALLALRVVALDRLQLLDTPSTPATPGLTAAHLHNLNISALEVRGVRGGARVRVAAGALAAPPLLDLRLERVDVGAGAELLHALPASLVRLSLTDCGVAALPADALARLPRLLHLSTREPSLREVRLPDGAALHDAMLVAPLDALPVPARLEELSAMTTEGVELRGPCAALRKLTVSGVAVRTLPARWLANCSSLRALHLQWLTALDALPAQLLAGPAELTNLTITRCRLRTLPPDLLVDTRNLLALDLSYNHLESLPQDLFSSVRGLETLDLSNNQLTSQSVGATLPSLKSLRELSLSYNPIGDLCGGDAGAGAGADAGAGYRDVVSPLWQLPALRAAALRATRATRLCPDWRLSAVRRLDLRDNALRSLAYEQLQWAGAGAGAGPAVVDLRGNNITRVEFTRDDYERWAAAPGAAVSVRLDSALQCDCHAYWLWRAVSERGAAAGWAAALRCGPPLLRPLAAAPARALVCPLPAAQCAPRCACTVREAELEQACEGAGLTAVPPPPAAAPRARLLLAHNGIASLRPADITPGLLSIDLTDNRIERLEPAAAAALFAGGARRVRLAGNPLRCDCAAAAALRQLHARRDQLDDYDALRCADGRALRAVPPAAACDAEHTWAAAGAATGALLLLLSAAAGALLWRADTRRRLKVCLLHRALCLRRLLRPAAAEGGAGTEGGAGAEGGDGEDAARPYDAFVSFSHGDEAWVAEQLVPRLERAGLRLCVHYRDWTPGDWIPAQIARSVRGSRRTLVLLSEHFVRSTWARHEFREAYAAALGDARPRLLVVLLCAEAELPRLPLDPELRAYLTANTYLCRDDPHFWPRLLSAMPPPRTLTTPAPPAPPAPPAAPALADAATAPPALISSPTFSTSPVA